MRELREQAQLGVRIQAAVPEIGLRVAGTDQPQRLGDQGGVLRHRRPARLQHSRPIPRLRQRRRRHLRQAEVVVVVHVPLLSEGAEDEEGPAHPPKTPHGRQASVMSHVQRPVHQESPLDQAHEDARENGRGTSVRRMRHVLHEAEQSAVTQEDAQVGLGGEERRRRERATVDCRR